MKVFKKITTLALSAAAIALMLSLSITIVPTAGSAANGDFMEEVQQQCVTFVKQKAKSCGKRKIDQLITKCCGSPEQIAACEAEYGDLVASYDYIDSIGETGSSAASAAFDAY